MILLLVFGGRFLPRSSGSGRMLAPFFFSPLWCWRFLLQGVVSALTRRRVPHLLAVILVFVAFVSVLLGACLHLMPLIWNQLVGLVQETPRMFASGQGWLDQ
ncbi:permase, partial [Halomonas sp. SUBG004]